ncbi:MAG: SH3 domain-containing protein, partial [Chloroflexota bacterium]|nr:SH3 domain-containing protein [Chloroflexota bacterium]
MPDYRAYAREAAQRAGCDPDVFNRQIQQESGFDPDAYNTASGATGICQIIPEYHPEVDPRDPIASLDYAARWMASLHRQYGSYARALAAYNWGPGNVAGWDGRRDALPGETRHYLDVILGPGWPEPGARTDGGTDGTSGGRPAVARFRVARVGADRLNLRTSPTISAPIVDRLAEGTVLEATGPAQDADGRTWVAVRVPNGAEGWVAKAFLDAIAERYRVTDDQVRLRQQPGTDAPILAELNRGALVDDAGAEPVSAGGHFWRQVRAGERVGWMAAGFLELAGAAAPTTAGTDDATSGASVDEVAAGARFRVARVGSDRLNLRSGPSLSAPLVDRLAEGTIVVALGPSREADGRAWLSVQSPAGVVGWAAA